MRKLGKKQKRFVDEYLIDLNATQAAIRAGYSPKRADQIGYENLRKPEIAKSIRAAQAKREQRTEISQDRVLKEYARIAFLDVRKFFKPNGELIPIVELDDETAAALAGMDVIERTVREGDEFVTQKTKKIKIADKLKALQDVGKHLGMFDRKEEENDDAATELLEELARRLPE